MESKLPNDTDFRQQRLIAWKPIMTAGSVLPIFLAIGVIFVPLGVTFLMASNSITELVIDYTNSCYSQEIGANCQEEIAKQPGSTCPCNVHINLSQDFLGQVMIYYGLQNYYQNHRRFTKSCGSSLDYTMCEQRVNNLSIGITNSPSWLSVNSQFNDSFYLLYTSGSTFIPVHFKSIGIAWEADSSKLSSFNKPSEELLVWIRTAALPNFRKFHGKIKHTGLFSDGLPSGEYIISINYTYPVVAHGGKKQIIFTTTSWIGGKNHFLGIAYILTGSIAFLFGIIFIFFHIKFGLHPINLLQDLISHPM